MHHESVCKIVIGMGFDLSEWLLIRLYLSQQRRAVDDFDELPVECSYVFVLGSPHSLNEWKFEHNKLLVSLVLLQLNVLVFD